MGFERRPPSVFTALVRRRRYYFTKTESYSDAVPAIAGIQKRSALAGRPNETVAAMADTCCNRSRDHTKHPVVRVLPGLVNGMSGDNWHYFKRVTEASGVSSSSLSSF